MARIQRGRVECRCYCVREEAWQPFSPLCECPTIPRIASVYITLLLSARSHVLIISPEKFRSVSQNSTRRFQAIQLKLQALTSSTCKCTSVVPASPPEDHEQKIKDEIWNLRTCTCYCIEFLPHSSVSLLEGLTAY